MTKRLVIVLIIAATTAYSNVCADMILTQQEKGWIQDHPLVSSGIRRALPELVSIMNKAIADITPEEDQAIEREGVSLRYETGLDRKTVYQWLFIIVSFFGAILVVILVWNRKLKKEIQIRICAEQQLAERNRFIESVINLSPAILYIYDIVERKNIYSNNGIENILGYSAEEIKNMGEQMIAILMHPDDLKIYLSDILPRYAQAKNSEQIFHEYRMQHRNGEWHQLESTEIIYKRLEDGSPAQIFGVLNDITRRRQTEQALRDSEERYRAIFNGMTEGFALHEIICDAGGIPRDYRFLEINPSFERLTGLKRADVLGQVQSQLLPDEDPKWVEMYGRVALTGEPCQFENYSPVLKRYFQVFAYSPAPYQFAVLFMDITERRLTEDSLRDSEERLASVLEGSQLGYWDWDITTGKVERNERWAKMLGYTLPEIELSVKQWTDLHHPDDQQIALQSLNDHLEGRTEMHKAEYRMKTKDGQYRWILDCAKIVRRDAEGCPLRMSGTHTDISDRKKIEDEIHKLNTELENRVLERTTQLETSNRELEAANIRLEASNKEMESFSYSVSHDLRSPLRSIDGWSLALAEDFEESIGEQGKAYIARIRSETQRMGQLIDNLLKLSRITRTEMFLTLVNLSDLAKKVADMLNEANMEKKIQFVIEPGLTAYADAGMMDIILTNLVENALKFTGKTPIPRIEFGKLKKSLSQMKFKDSNRQIFFIKDNGAGFDMTYNSKLFGAFQRLHKSEEFPGTGIGLAIVQRIIHRHGGRIWAEGAISQGATFYFTL